MKKILLTTAVVLCSQFIALPYAEAAGISATSIAADVSNPSAEEQQKLFTAIDNGNLDSLRAHVDFVKAFVQIDPNYTPDKGLGLEFRDENGNTPLIRAAMQKSLKVVSFLVNNGSNINAQNTKYETPLIVAYNTKNYPIARYLLSKGAADPYNVARRMQEVRIQEAHSTSNHDLLMDTVYVAGAGGAIAALAAAGGSGGGSSSSSTTVTVPPSGTIDPINFASDAARNAAAAALGVTTEAHNQEGIDAMGVTNALVRGYDGSIYSRNSDGTLANSTPVGHVLVAVMDSGVDLTHPELAPNISTTVPSVTCDGSGCSAGGVDDYNHGTWVAGIIGAVKTSNTSGAGLTGDPIFGVAPGANLVSIKVLDSSGSFTTATEPDIAGIAYAITNGVQIINSSFGLSGNIFTYTPTYTSGQFSVQDFLNGTHAGSSLVQQYASLVSHGMVEVFSAGNNGDANPTLNAALPYYFQGATAPSGLSQTTYDTVNPGHLDFSKNWVAVVGLDSTNHLFSSNGETSQGCGVAMNWCIAAPGIVTSSTTRDGNFLPSNSFLVGTSFAAPNVSGAIADMMGAFPQLTAQQVLQILFNTATDLGAPGVDAVYGHGLLNLAKAISPTTGGWTLGTSGGTSYNFDTSGFTLSAPFGNVLTTANMNLQFLDAYGKNYTIPISDVSGNLNQSKTTLDKFQSFANDNNFDNVLSLGDNARLSFTSATDSKLPQSTSPDKMAKASYFMSLPVGNDIAAVAINYKTNLAADLISQGTGGHITSDAFKNPYVNMLDSSNSSIASYAYGASKVTMAAYSGRFDNSDYTYHFGDRKNLTGFYSQYTYKDKDTHSSLSLEEGMTQESNSLLGSELSGAFAVDKATTYHAGISGELMLAHDLALLGNYNLGLTKVAADGNSLFTNFGNLTTSAFAAGVELRNATGDNDTLGFAVSQPIRVTSGHASLALPVGVNADGSMVFQNNALNLAPSARELDFETYYGINFTKDSELNLDATFRLNPDNSNVQAATDTTVLVKYNLKF